MKRVPGPPGRLRGTRKNTGATKCHQHVVEVPSGGLRGEHSGRTTVAVNLNRSAFIRTRSRVWLSRWEACNEPVTALPLLRVAENQAREVNEALCYVNITETQGRSRCPAYDGREVRSPLRALAPTQRWRQVFSRIPTAVCACVTLRPEGSTLTFPFAGSVPTLITHRGKAMSLRGSSRPIKRRRPV